MIRAAPLNPEVQSLSQIHEAVARAQAVLKGDFRKELEAMSALREELKERQGVIDTVAKAAQVKAEADAYTVQRREETDKLHSLARESNNKAAAKLVTVLAREEAVEKRERSAQDRVMELERTIAQSRLASDQRVAELNRRETHLATQEADYTRRLKVLAEKERKLKDALGEIA